MFRKDGTDMQENKQEQVRREIRMLAGCEMEEALALVWEGFSDFQAQDCSEETIDEFWSAIDQEYMIQQYGDGIVRFWGAFEDDFLVGVCAIREMRRVELMYVDGQYHRLGIGTSLLKKAVMDTKEIALDMDRLHVNASPYSVPFFQAMGFKPTGPVEEEGGLKYQPMMIQGLWV
jgi:N-acetylglutamate synthase-like GNAT family acetyltransferase